MPKYFSQKCPIFERLIKSEIREFFSLIQIIRCSFVRNFSHISTFCRFQNKKLFEILEFLKFGVSGKFLPLFLPRALIGWGPRHNDSRLSEQKGDAYANWPKNIDHRNENCKRASERPSESSTMFL